jgi:hypothetical protein
VLEHDGVNSTFLKLQDVFDDAVASLPSIEAYDAFSFSPITVVVRVLASQRTSASRISSASFCSLGPHPIHEVTNRATRARRTERRSERNDR